MTRASSPGSINLKGVQLLSRIIAYAFTCILMAAHFSRAGHDLIAVFVLLIPFLLLIRKPWVIHALQYTAYLAAAVWLYAAYEYVELRIDQGDDWLRLLFILGAVAIYSAWSGYFLMSDAVKARYGLDRSE